MSEAQRIENYKTCIQDIEDALKAGLTDDKPISAHQQIGAHKDLLRLKGEMEDIIEGAESKESARSADSFEQQLLAQEIQIRCLKASLKESTLRAEDLKETLDAMRSQDVDATV